MYDDVVGDPRFTHSPNDEHFRDVLFLVYRKRGSSPKIITMDSIIEGTKLSEINSKRMQLLKHQANTDPKSLSKLAIGVPDTSFRIEKMPFESKQLSPFDQTYYWNKSRSTNTLINMTNNSPKLEKWEKTWLRKKLNKRYPKSSMSENGEIFELFAGFVRF